MRFATRVRSRSRSRDRDTPFFDQSISIADIVVLTCWTDWMALLSDVAVIKFALDLQEPASDNGERYTAYTESTAEMSVSFVVS